VYSLTGYRWTEVTMPTETEYRVISESEGWVTERDERESAEDRAEEFNQDPRLPDDHYVEEHTEVF